MEGDHRTDGGAPCFGSAEAGEFDAQGDASHVYLRDVRMAYDNRRVFESLSCSCRAAAFR